MAGTDQFVQAPGQPTTVPLLKERGTRRRRRLRCTTHALQYAAQPPSPLPGTPSGLTSVFPCGERLGEPKSRAVS
jgi:hypothetical protein